MNQNSTQPRVAFLGIGLMGLPMACRVVQAGYVTTAWNRTRAKAEAVTGAQVATTMEEAVRDADVVITMLEKGQVVLEVAETVLTSLRPGSMFIDMSSTSQAEAVELSAKLSGQGVRFLDAPVSGGVIGAERGELAIMVGGDEDDFHRAAPLLGAMGRPTRVGAAGCGQLAKLCNQLIVGATLDIVAEALLLAQAGGADPAAVRAALRGGFAESRILDVHGARMLERNFLPGGQVKSQTKDLDNVLAAARGAGVRLPVAELVAEHFRSILDLYPRADQSAALLALERANPGKRLGQGEDRLP